MLIWAISPLRILGGRVRAIPSTGPSVNAVCARYLSEVGVQWRVDLKAVAWSEAGMVQWALSLLQGLMFGYATDETEECMPLTIILAHKLNARMAELRRSGVLPWLRPDSKTQVGLSFAPGYRHTLQVLLLLSFPLNPKCAIWTQRSVRFEKSYLLEKLLVLDVFYPPFYYEKFQKD